MTSLIANPDWIAAARKCVQDAPFPNLVGIELTALDFDSCRLELTLGERHMQPFGIVHGGVIATLIDSATFWAVYLRLPDSTGLVNVDLKLNYLKATTTGRMTVYSQCLRAGRQLSYAEPASSMNRACSSHTGRPHSWPCRGPACNSASRSSSQSD